jgi:polyhydroxybutyrate depolymerase
LPSAVEEIRLGQSVAYLFAPSDGDDPLPLTMVLHGGSMTARQLADSYDYARQADAQGSLFVLPETTSVAGIEELLDHLGEGWNIDGSRIFAQGASAGGLLAARLGCELADRFAAIGTGAGFGIPDPILCQRPSRPVPLTSFIDPADPFFVFDEVEEGHGRWAEWNGCAPTPERTEVGEEVQVIRWQGCDDDATVELYVVEGLGHRWPATDCLPSAPSGLCAERDDFDGGEVQWQFFQEHPMP